MKIDWKDLMPLRWPVLLLAICVTVSALLINYASDRQAAVSEEIRIARNNADEARRRFQDSDLEKALIAQYLPAFRELQQRNIIGSENRLKWIAALRIADRETANFGVTYKLEAQSAYKGPLSSEPIAAHLRQSTMDISYRVVHEEQFLAFIDALNAQNAGIYSLRSCTLEPAHNGKPQPRGENLSARCLIDWVTMIPPEKDES